MNEITTSNSKAAIDRIVEILRSARERPEMYFNPISPAAVIDYLSGLRTGVFVFGLLWSSDCRQSVLESRGLELKARWEDDDLRQRGLDPAQVVHELLSIEIEMWECQRSNASGGGPLGLE